jgi:hypothetical protein
MSLEGLVSRKMLHQRRVRATIVIWQAKKLSRLFRLKKILKKAEHFLGDSIKKSKS